MYSSENLTSLEQAVPGLQVLTPHSAGWTDRRATRGQAGQELKPIGIAIPKDAEQVAAIVRWANAEGVEFTVRTGGNDFYGRNAADGCLIIDMRDINSIAVAADKKTATIGGGVISKDLLGKLEEEGLMAPFGNTWIVGYVGWATLGGYGPLTNLLGMGYEGILGATVVNAEGELVEADEEMLEGIRGMGGNLGIITSMTIKVYPGTKLFSGMLMFEATAENVNAIIAAEANIDIPKCLTTHHFILKLQQRMLAIMFTWSDPDHGKAQSYLQDFLNVLPPVMANTIQTKTLTKHFEDVPLHCLPWGGQRSLYLSHMSAPVVDILMDALSRMPDEPNMGWSMTLQADPPGAPPNCFGVGTHIMLSFSDMVPEERLLAPAREWNNALFEKLIDSGDPALMGGSYPPLTRPGDKTPEELFGKKWARAKALKEKYDPQNVFKYAVPKM